MARSGLACRGVTRGGLPSWRLARRVAGRRRRRDAARRGDPSPPSSVRRRRPTSGGARSRRAAVRRRRWPVVRGRGPGRRVAGGRRPTGGGRRRGSPVRGPGAGRRGRRGPTGAGRAAAQLSPRGLLPLTRRWGPRSGPGELALRRRERLARPGRCAGRRLGRTRVPRGPVGLTPRSCAGAVGLSPARGRSRSVVGRARGARPGAPLRSGSPAGAGTPGIRTRRVSG